MVHTTCFSKNMDSQCRTALCSMNFEDRVIGIFKDKGIDFNTLYDFPESIPSILPSLSDQLKLRKGLQLLVEAQQPLTRQTEASTSSNISYCTEGAPTSSGSSILLDDVVSVISVSEIGQICDNAENLGQKRPRLDISGTEGGLVIAVSVESETNTTEPQAKTSNVIFDVLKKSVQGQLIIKTHQLRGFDNSTRCKLADIIVNSEYGTHFNTEIHSEHFKKLAQWIVECFPGECAETFFISSSSRGKGRAASGKLYDNYTNLNKELRKGGLRTIHAGPSRDLHGTVGINAVIPPVPPAGDLAVKRALEFLSVYLEPWELVQQHWETSCASRLQDLRNPRNDELQLVSHYVSKFPVLKQSSGHSLLEHDFKVLFPEAADRMSTHWSEFEAKLKQEFIRAGIKDIETETELLFNFPRIFSVVPVQVPRKKPWRATRAEIQEGFLVHIKAIGDFEKQLEDMKKTVRSRGIQLQPFPLIVGESLNNITSSYAVVDDRPLRVESPRRAVEVTFKTFHALYCNYPVQSERLWMVLQKALFGVNEEWESNIKNAPEVLRLISVLKCGE